MNKSDLQKNLEEACDIFAKYENEGKLNVQQRRVQVSLNEEITPEDNSRLLELGWKFSDGTYLMTQRTDGN